MTQQFRQNEFIEQWFKAELITGQYTKNAKMPKQEREEEWVDWAYVDLLSGSLERWDTKIHALDYKDTRCLFH